MRKLLLLVSIVFFATSLSARHIVGGGVTYRCVGPGQYEFRMEVYRDCFGGGAEFDEQAAMTVYTVDANGRTRLFLNLDINRDAIFSVQDPVNECLVLPPNICVEGTTYRTGVLNLPVDTTISYVIAYQRCCRNETITNVRMPGDVGSTYSVEITPAAQLVCNNSPTFNEFPPTVICNNIPLVFDHSATDAEGDSLVYSFCSTQIGGGLRGATIPGDPTDPDGVAPDPATPPPYNLVPFAEPTFTAEVPMLGNPIVSINSATGLITGTPNILGQFVVGVCVREYRNGELLSVISRDFQFNVAQCDPEVFAEIEADSTFSDNGYFILSCGDSTIPFSNRSRDENFIRSYEWKFSVPGDTIEFDTRDISISFPDTGLYRGQLILNKGLECSDTANIEIGVFPAVNADFDFVYDTCNPTPVAYTNMSFSDGGVPITGYSWDFNDGEFSDEESPVHLFTTAGNFNVQLEVQDANTCSDSISKPISWFPVPVFLSADPVNADGCQPLEVFFQNTVFPLNDQYEYLWEFGDGTIDTVFEPLHTFEDFGVFDVSLFVSSPTGCVNDASFSNLIRVKESPVAGFDFSPKELTNFNPTVSFFDQSQKAEAWQYLLGEDVTLFEREPTYTFPDTGMVFVQQVVARFNGCTDTATALIDVIPTVTYFLPNAFTPNRDNLNDGFSGVGFFEGMQDFQMTVWNRWGELVFETDDPNEQWNGQKDNNGELSPQGVYVYVVNYKEPRGKGVKLKGYVTLLL